MENDYKATPLISEARKIAEETDALIEEVLEEFPELKKGYENASRRRPYDGDSFFSL